MSQLKFRQLANAANEPASINIRLPSDGPFPRLFKFPDSHVFTLINASTALTHRTDLSTVLHTSTIKGPSTAEGPLMEPGPLAACDSSTKH